MQAVSCMSALGPYNAPMPMGRPTAKPRAALGERIAAARLEAGLTQQQLADKLGVTQRVVTYWEREAAGLRADQLAKLAEALGVSADFFLGREQKKRSNGPVGKAKAIFDRVSALPRDRQQKILGAVEDMLVAHENRKAS
jgi:transcriptional regulator with XRE-family HTH domain